MKKIVLSSIIVLIFTSCATVGSLAQIGSATGLISESQANAITETAEAGEKAIADITPEQEYYIGRAVGATVLSKYKVLNDYEANIYLNKLGKALSLGSTRPETFGGYHFLILDSEEINAFAAPSGHVFISKGMLKLTKNEDDVAAILAHEIAHVSLQHGLQAIKKSRVTGFLTVLGTNAAKELGGQEIAELTTMFEDTISDITSTMINNGYSRAYEKDADKAAIEILDKMGYDKNALIRVLDVMGNNLKPGGLDFAKTHPDPNVRIKDIAKNTGVKGHGNIKASNNRYKTALRNIL